MARRLLCVARMSRMRIALALAFVAALVLASSACEHKGCDEALKICRADFGNEPNASQTQSASTDDLKTALGRLQAKVQWPTEAPENAYARGSGGARLSKILEVLDHLRQEAPAQLDETRLRRPRN